MKPKILILAILVIQVIFAGCKKEKADYSNEPITVDNQPDKEKKFF
jgi:nitrous oxide reductase accessory protein NosL